MAKEIANKTVTNMTHVRRTIMALQLRFAPVLSLQTVTVPIRDRRR